MRTALFSFKKIYFLCFLTIGLSACGGGGGSDSTDETIAEDMTAAERVFRIMPLGDSITEAEGGRASYRYWLWKLIEESGNQVDFVGSQKGVYRGEPKFADFDTDHQGQWDWTSDQLRFLSAKFAAANVPDVVLLHIGTNDIRRSQSASSTANDIAVIVENFREVNPRVVFLVAQIIPTSVNSDKIPFFNSLLPDLVSSLSTGESPVHLVDQFSGFSLEQDTYDGVHPNDRGEKKMADVWFDGLLNYVF